MKNVIRIISLLLAIIMVSSAFVACGPQEEPPTNVPSQTMAFTEPDEEMVKPLSSMFWDGEEYRILGNKSDNKGFHNFEIDYDEMPEDVVGLAVWNRNNAIMSKYGLDVVGTLVENAYDTAQMFLESGEDTYDLIVVHNRVMLNYATKGYLANLNDVEYIDFEKDCWDTDVNKQFTYGDKLYYTTNKFLLQDKHRTWINWYNRSLAKELNVGRIEDEVFAGTWTIDRLIEIAKTCSSNTDGVEGMTSTDTWGFVSSDPFTFGVLAYGVGFRLSNTGADGYPSLIGATDQMISLLDKVFELSSDQTISFFSEYRPTSDENTAGRGEPIFREGRAVVMGHCLSYLDSLGKLDFEYGVLPNPKYNEDQEKYIAVPNIGNGYLFAIPTTVNDIDKAGFGLEAISEEAVDTSYREYIETRCKLQDSYDEDMAKCLTIIFDGISYDVAMIDDLGGLGKLMHTQLLKSGVNTYARQYDKLEKKAINQLKSIKEDFKKLDALN